MKSIVDGEQKKINCGQNNYKQMFYYFVLNVQKSILLCQVYVCHKLIGQKGRNPCNQLTKQRKMNVWTKSVEMKIINFKKKIYIYYYQKIYKKLLKTYIILFNNFLVVQ